MPGQNLSFLVILSYARTPELASYQVTNFVFLSLRVKWFTMHAFSPHIAVIYLPILDGVSVSEHASCQRKCRQVKAVASRP